MLCIASAAFKDALTVGVQGSELLLQLLQARFVCKNEPILSALATNWQNKIS